jgi:hypothetical protein
MPYNPNPGRPTPNLMPKNYKPKGINNLPGQKIPFSNSASKGARRLVGATRLLGAIGKFLQALAGIGEIGLGGVVVAPVIECHPTLGGPNPYPYDPELNPWGVI